MFHAKHLLDISSWTMLIASVLYFLNALQDGSQLSMVAAALNIIAMAIIVTVVEH